MNNTFPPFASSRGMKATYLKKQADAALSAGNAKEAYLK
jgi:hypothetical protein